MLVYNDGKFPLTGYFQFNNFLLIRCLPAIQTVQILCHGMSNFIMDDSGDLQTWNEGVPVKGYAVRLIAESFIQPF